MPKLATACALTACLSMAAVAAYGAENGDTRIPAAKNDTGQTLGVFKRGEQKGEPQPTPRLADGTVDLGGDGVWNIGWVRDYATQIVDKPGGKPHKGEIPMLPWTKAMLKYNDDNHQIYDPEGFCLPPGGPRAFATPYPAQFLQVPGRIYVVFEGGAHVWREIDLDRKEHPKNVNPTYFGDSIAHWDGDTLVVDTVGYNERSWLGFLGYMHTEKLHTIERITRPNKGTLHYEITIDDPDAYSRPWIMGWDIRWSEGQRLQEYICQENNQYLTDLKDDLGAPFFKTTPIDESYKKGESD